MDKAKLTETVPGLAFRIYDLREAGSVSALFTDPKRRCGIYVLDFADGDTYVGQTVNIITRFAKHRRTWPDIVGLRFAECPRPELTAHELLMIKRQEELGDVRNRNSTGKPGGSEDLIVTTTAGTTVVLPWDRGHRITIGKPDSATPEATVRQRKQLAALRKLPGYAGLLDVLGQYVAETIPDPSGTQGIWSLTAMAGYNKDFPRVATLSIGQIEVLFAYLDKEAAGNIGVSFNVRGGAGFESALKKGVSRETRAQYAVWPSGRKVAYRVDEVGTISMDACRDLLTQPVMLDAAYKLNVTLMRQGSRAYSRYHNPVFAAEVLAAGSARRDR